MFSLFDHTSKFRDQFADPFIFHFHADLIDYHTCRQRADFFQHLQAILAKGASGFHDIHDNLGKSYDRCKLDGTVQLNDLHSLVLFVLEIILCNIWIFCSYTDQLIVIQDFSGAFRTAYAHAACSKSKIHNLI